ncbi:MAG TPA: hypothetical protein VKQ29_16995 [Aliidongia sp.]|nr:hypothetical protein [Aliidongia sp.]
MSTHHFMVLSDPVAGQDAAYNDWYDNRHLADVLKVDGFVSAQRFRLSHQTPPAGIPASGYLAIYEIETDDVDATLAALMARLGTEVMPVTPAIDTQRLNMFVATALAPVKRRA